MKLFQKWPFFANFSDGHPPWEVGLTLFDRQIAARIVKTLEERIAPLDDARATGSALVSEHGGTWRWRIGDYRVVARIEDERITVLVVRWRIGGRFIGEDLD